MKILEKNFQSRRQILTARGVYQFETCRHNGSWKYFEFVDQGYCVGEAGDHGSDPESQSESDFQRSEGLNNFDVL